MNELLAALPRPSFRPAGRIAWAELATEPPKHKTPGTTSRAQRLGKRYEAKALKYLSSCETKAFLPSPWIKFANVDTNDHWRFCQPDAILFLSKNRLLVVEVKYTHTADAFFQLQQLYYPVVKELFPKYDIYLCEMTRSYDPLIGLPDPRPVDLHFSFSSLVDSLVPSNAKPPVKVFQWTK